MFILIIILFSANVFAQNTYRTFSNGLNKSGKEYILNFSSFATEKYKNNFNNDVSLQEGESFVERDLDLYLRYGLADQLELGFFGKFRQVSAKYEQGAGPTLESISSSGIHSLGIDLKYQFDRSKNSNWEFASLFSFGTTLFPEASGAEVNNHLALGDKGSFYHVGGALSYFLTDENFVTTKMLFRSPGASISKEIFYQAELALLWPKFVLLGGIEGIRSLGTDAYTDDPGDKPAIDVSATNRYNSINRNIVEGYVGGRFNITQKVDLGLKMKTTLALNRSDYGQTILADLRFINNEKKTKDINKQFKNYRVEAEIIKISPAGKFLMIDKGLSDDVVKGMRFHVFVNDYTGGSKLVAIATAVKVQSNKSIIKILKRYSRRKIQAGFVVRGGQIE